MALQPQLLDQATRWVLDSLGEGAELQAIAPLAGGISSALYRLVVIREGQSPLEVVLRLFTNQAWLQVEPDLVRHEVAALTWAEQISLPTPRPLAFDETGVAAGAPAVLMSKLEGRIELQPSNLNSWLAEMARALLLIHQTPPPPGPWTYYPYCDLNTMAPPAWSSLPAEWASAIRIARGAPPASKPCFIHRDYHPTNLLWTGDRVSGIVDWVNACRGPAGVDIGHCRLNLALLMGLEAADGFLQHYCAQAASTFEYEPYWDLVALLSGGVEDEPSVYGGWVDSGVTHLTPAIIAARMEAYLVSLLRRYGEIVKT